MMREVPFATHSKPVGWAVLGLGMGAVHARLIGRSPGLRLIAVCDSNPDVLERRAADIPAGTTVHSSIDALLDDKRVEGVSVVLPHDLHAPVALRLLEAGRHVVLDKPFSLTVAEGRRMIATARRRRRLLSAFHNRRWDVDYETVRRLAESGRFGRIRYLESRISQAGRLGPGRWRAERKHMGGLLYDWGAHLVDQALRLIPARPVSVYGLAQRDLPPEPGWDVEDRMQALIRFEDGAAALVAWALGSPAPMPRFVVEFERGGVRVEHLVQNYPEADEQRRGIVSYREVRGADGRMTVEQKALRYARIGWEGYYRNVGAALLGRAPLAVTPEQALCNVAICEAAYASARTGQSVRLARALFA
jgi:scyllo-inositol 2-dehydrogenase (NADP+)